MPFFDICFIKFEASSKLHKYLCVYIFLIFIFINMEKC